MKRYTPVWWHKTEGEGFRFFLKDMCRLESLLLAISRSWLDGTDDPSSSLRFAAFDYANGCLKWIDRLEPQLEPYLELNWGRLRETLARMPDFLDECGSDPERYYDGWAVYYQVRALNDDLEKCRKGINTSNPLSAGLVTLQQMAHISKRKKSTLRVWSRGPDWPPPAVKASMRGQANLWKWETVRPVFEKKSGMQFSDLSAAIEAGVL